MCKCVCVCVGGGHFSRYPTHKCKLRLSASAELGHLAFMGLSFSFFSHPSTTKPISVNHSLHMEAQES